MRPLLSVAAALLVLTAALSGCFGSDDAMPPSDAAAAAAARDAAMAEGNLTNVSVDDGTGAMDVDVGHAPHIHDYWTGRERVTLMDQDVQVDAQRAIPFTFFNTFSGTPAVGGTVVELPDGAIVYEGTGAMEFTVTWSDATITGMGLRYRDASSTTFSEPQPLVNGEALVTEVTPVMTDMPHGQTSRWAFILAPTEAGQSMVGAFHVKVDIVKMRDIALFPGHPELFNGASTLTLFSGAGESSQSNFATQAVTFATGGSFEQPGVRSEKVVPMETLTMTANLTITDVTGGNGEVSEVWMLFRPADSRGFYRGNLLEADAAAGIYKFAWPVEMHHADSPYATDSQWLFDVRVGTETVPGTPICETRCADVTVTYELEVVAYDARLPEAGDDPTERNDRDD